MHPQQNFNLHEAKAGRTEKKNRQTNNDIWRLPQKPQTTKTHTR